MTAQVQLYSPRTNGFFQELKIQGYRNRPELIAYFNQCNGNRAAFYRELLSKLSDYPRDVAKIMKIFDQCFASRAPIKRPVILSRQKNETVFKQFDFDYSDYSKQEDQQDISDLEFARNLSSFPKLAFAVSKRQKICIYDASMHINNYLKEYGDLTSININDFISWLKTQKPIN